MSVKGLDAERPHLPPSAEKLTFVATQSCICFAISFDLCFYISSTGETVLAALISLIHTRGQRNTRKITEASIINLLRQHVQGICKDCRYWGVFRRPWKMSMNMVEHAERLHEPPGICKQP